MESSPQDAFPAASALGCLAGCGGIIPASPRQTQGPGLPAWLQPRGSHPASVWMPVPGRPAPARRRARGTLTSVGLTAEAVKRHVCFYYHYFSFLNAIMLQHAWLFQI